MMQVFLRAAGALRMAGPAAWAGALCVGLLPGRLAPAVDVVELVAPARASSTPRARGEILDYTGRQLTLRLESGREEPIPADRIERVEFTKTAPHLQAEVHLREGRWEEALAAFREAMSADERVWVRRLLAAECVRCLQRLQQLPEAGRLFVSLCRSDPLPVGLDAIPLAWQAPRLPNDSVASARQWLADSAAPAQLLAASWLLAGPDRERARPALEKLAQHEDARLAGLAQAQGWRLQLASVPLAQVETWRGRVAHFSPSYRAGPRFLLAQAYARLEQHPRAALLAMQVAIDDPPDVTLTSASLLLAGRQLEAAGQPREALQCYDEILRDHAESEACLTARARRRELSEK